MPYSVDTSSLLDWWVRYYPPDLFGGLWDRIERAVALGTILVQDEVVRDLSRKDDMVYHWVKDHTCMHVPLDLEIQAAAGRIMDQFPNLVDIERQRSVSDPFVIALAQVRGIAVVTSEIEQGNRPKIPHVCRSLGIDCVGSLDFFRQQGWNGL